MLYLRSQLSTGAVQVIEAQFPGPLPDDLANLVRSILDEWHASFEERQRGSTLSSSEGDLVTYVRLGDEEIELPFTLPLEWHLSVVGPEPFFKGEVDFVLPVGTEAQRTHIVSRLKEVLIARLGITTDVQFSEQLVTLPAPSWGPPPDSGYRQDSLCTLGERTSLARRILREWWKFAELPDSEPAF